MIADWDEVLEDLGEQLSETYEYENGVDAYPLTTMKEGCAECGGGLGKIVGEMLFDGSFVRECMVCKRNNRVVDRRKRPYWAKGAR